MILWKDFKVIPSKYFLHILTEWNVRPLEIADSDSSHSWSCCCCKVALGWWRASDRPVASCAIIWLALLACPRESPSPAPPLSALLCYQVHPQWEKVIVGLWEWEDKSPLSSNVSPGPFRVPLASGCFWICFLLVHQPLHDEGQQGSIHNSPLGHFTTHCCVLLCLHWRWNNSQ